MESAFLFHGGMFLRDCSRRDLCGESCENREHSDDAMG